MGSVEALLAWMRADPPGRVRMSESRSSCIITHNFSRYSCRKCQTTYYKRYASSTPTEDDKAKKSLDIPQRLKYIEAHGEIRRLCTKCRTYFMALMDDVKRAVGKHGKESNR